MDLILDGGPCTIGVESTIVDVTVEPPALLRPGGIPLEALEAIVGGPVHTEDGGREPGPGDAGLALRARWRGSRWWRTRRTLAGGSSELRTLGERAELLDPGPDPDHYARHLYSWLRAADDGGVTTLVAVPPPAVGLGWAVRDRLRKAAAPR